MEFSNLIKSCFLAGQNTFIDSIKRSLYYSDNEIFEKIDFDDDELYLEPLLFIYFTVKEEKPLTLYQILYKKIKQWNQDDFTAYSNNYGQTYLANEYYLKIPDTENTQMLINQKLLNIEKGTQQEKVYCEYVIGTGIELCAYEIPGLNRFYQNWDMKGDEVIPITIDNDLFATCKILIEEAFELIRKYTEEYYFYCIKSTKKIVLFESAHIPGFVTREAHGVIFLTVQDKVNVAYFIDEIVHQCGHNVFNAVTCSIKEFIKINPSTRLRLLVGHDRVSDTSIDGAFHGLFTVCTGIQVLYKIFDANKLDKRNQHELKGRLAVKKTRFRTWTEDIIMTDVLTKKGMEIYRELDEGANLIIRRRPKLFENHDFSNQPYTFSYTKFLELNEI